MRTGVIVMVMATAIAAPAVADAQSLYVSGGAGLAWRQPGSPQNASDDAAPTRAATPSLRVAAGWWISPSLALEGSLQVQRRQTLSWLYTYTRVTRESSIDRDVPIAAHVRGVAWRGPVLSIEPVVGGGVSRHQSMSFSIADCFHPACLPITPPRRSDVYATWEGLLSVGVDLPVRAAAAVRVVPTTRLLYSHRRQYLTGNAFRGPGNGSGVMWEMGLALRWTRSRTGPGALPLRALGGSYVTSGCRQSAATNYRPCTCRCSSRPA